MKIIFVIVLIIVILNLMGLIIWYIFKSVNANVFYMDPLFIGNINEILNEYLCRIKYRSKSDPNEYNSYITNLNKEISKYYNNLLSLKNISPNSSYKDVDKEVKIRIQ